ncbi:MAG: carboxy terminal-processing peptidase, partial [Gammaproteobacteria bacterium]
MSKLINGAILLLSFVLSSGASALAPTVPVDELVPQPEHRRATRLITHFIANYHYKKATLDDALSEVIFENYLKALDPTRSYLLQTDVDDFSANAREFDDDLRNSDLHAVYEIFVRYRQRVEQRIAHAVSLLDKPMDFSVDESFDFDREDAPWPQNENELNELWRKRVKNDWLSLRLSGKQDKDIADTLRKRYQGLVRQTAQFNSEDVYQTFINAYTTAIDPHTAYFSPRTSENFKIRMSLSLEGIGAVLQSDNEYTLVREVVPGGPASKSGKLRANDRIVGIGQGAKGELVDVIGWRLDDVVDLIRGPKGSVVTLQVLPKGASPDATTRLIQLTRNTIQLDEQAAQRKVLEVPSGDARIRIGVIEIPTFYMDFEARMRGDENYRSTTRDVRRLIGELQGEKVAGIVIDLRGNGGGSLSEATELTGLFIDTGPVVQVRNSQGRVQLERDTDSGVAYDGPLTVLVDRNSASASEIFAAAIQDYRRGLVLGEPTFGKGTVQNLVDLNRFDEEANGKLGQLKATIAQFFRVEGDSTQHRGVLPDINFPSGFSAEEQGERALDHALPFAHIAAVRYTPAPTLVPDVQKLRELHATRVAKDAAYQALLAQERAVQDAADTTVVSLLESKRKAEHDKARREQNARE